MRASRVAAAVAVVASMSGPIARSQVASHAPDDDDGASAGSAKALVAPAEPRARVAWLRDRVAAAIAAAPRLGKAAIGVAVVDLATGEELAAHDGDRALSLASTAKLLTASAGLAVLGGGFRWRTTVYGDEPDDHGQLAGPLYVRGRGDPLLGGADLAALAADVAARGVRSVERLVIDASYFDDAIEPPRFADQPAESAGFRAPVAAFAVARGAVTVIVTAEPGGGAKIALDPEPEPGGVVRVVNKGTTSAPKIHTRLRVELRPRKDHAELEVGGELRWGEGSYEVRRRVPDPVRFAGEVFRRALAAHGVKVRARAIGLGPVPPAAKQLAVHDSPPLAEVVRHMNKQSDNYLAEVVLKTLGAEAKTTAGPARWADGLAARDAAIAKLGLPAGSYRADNGSGLFDASAMSARQLTALLRAAHQDYRVGPDLVASLPIGGVDGTLARRWAGRLARGRVRAKTGTLDKVAALAGYAAVDGQHAVAFTILVNDIPPGQRASARATADDIVDALIAYLGPPR